MEAELDASRMALDDYVRLAHLAADFSAFAQTEDKCPKCELVAKWSVLKNWAMGEQLAALKAQASIRNIAEPANQEAWIRYSERAAVYGRIASEPQRMGGVDHATVIREQVTQKAGLVNRLYAATLELRDRIMKRNS